MRAWHLASLIAVGVIWSCAEGTSFDGECVTVWHRDYDGDGFGSEVDTVVACEKPQGFIREGGDCDDFFAEIYPGAEENCAEDKDYNCDGSSGFDDLDMDGAAACVDCDDQDPERHPGAMEVCDGIDNDCDMLIDLDDEPDNVLCEPVVNATPMCVAAMCTFACDMDYVDVNQDPTDGCECLSQPSSAVGDSCANPHDLGDLIDGNADSALVDINLPLGTERWVRFNAVDDVDTNGDEFHVDVRFTNNPGNGYAMTVYRGNCPEDNGELLATDEPDMFDWFTDFNYTTMGCTAMSPCGEGDCSDVPSTTVNLCNDDSAPFYVRITRLDQQASCELVSLEFSNGVY